MTDQLITFKIAELAREAGFKEEQDYQYIRYNQDLKITYVDIKSGNIRLVNRRDSYTSLVAGEEFFSTYYALHNHYSRNG